MQRSLDRILTTHVGSLPRAAELYVALQRKESGAEYDEAALAASVRDSVTNVVGRQGDIAVDVVNDGEHSKSSFSAYTASRLEGFSPLDEPRRKREKTRDRKSVV